MSYLLDRKIRQGKFFKITVGVLLLIVLFYFRTGIHAGLSYVVREVFHPILILGNKAGSSLGNLGAYFSSKKFLYAENENLWRKLETQSAELINREALVFENESLKEIFSRAPEKKEIILAAIISKPNRSPYDTLLLDVGEKDGVETGAAVYALGDIPIGRVNSITPDTSNAILFSSSKETTQVIVPVSLEQGGTKEMFWELVGRGGGNFEMTLPRDFILGQDAVVVLPGIRPYAVAIVETILSDPRDPFKKALFRSPVNIQDLKFVEVEL